MNRDTVIDAYARVFGRREFVTREGEL